MQLSNHAWWMGLVLAGVVAHADTVAALDCDFGNSPARASALKWSFVRAYAGCPSIGYPATNSQTSSNVPTCAPPFALSVFRFDDRTGSCSARSSAKLEEPCTLPAPEPCMNLSIKAKCAGVLTSDGVTPIDGIDYFGVGWRLTGIVRVTFDDQTYGGMTVIDLPLDVEFPAAAGGKLTLVSDTHATFGAWLGPLPACTQLELVRISIVDPDGQVFAQLGVGTRPQAQ